MPGENARLATAERRQESTEGKERHDRTRRGGWEQEVWCYQRRRHCEGQESGLTSVRLLGHLSLTVAEDKKLESRGHVIFRTGLSLAAAIGERVGIHGVWQGISRSTGHMSVVIGDGWTIKGRSGGKGIWNVGMLKSHLWNEAGRRNPVEMLINGDVMIHVSAKKSFDLWIVICDLWFVMTGQEGFWSFWIFKANGILWWQVMTRQWQGGKCSEIEMEGALKMKMTRDCLRCWTTTRRDDMMMDTLMIKMRIMESGINTLAVFACTRPVLRVLVKALYKDWILRRHWRPDQAWWKDGKMETGDLYWPVGCIHDCRLILANVMITSTMISTPSSSQQTIIIQRLRKQWWRQDRPDRPSDQRDCKIVARYKWTGSEQMQMKMEMKLELELELK